ncbi:hypothetical protein NDU88_005500 [Pleurodeles waltl]|uniref:Uncharacterized protein n=1 Tax=Pleurodeles waltl TaxID=8319 RepID=A0AAV7SLT3_PLEWA|nr:hypothetical protein NDU88_005500 [Pleurodeles waltl]
MDPLESSWKVSRAAGIAAKLFAPPGPNVRTSGILLQWSLSLEMCGPPSRQAENCPVRREVLLRFMCLRVQMSVTVTSCRNGICA